MAQSQKREVGPPAARKKPARVSAKGKAEKEAKLRPTAVELTHSAKQRLPEYCRLNALFHDQKKMEGKLNEMLLLCPDSQKDLFFEWLAHSPFEVSPKTWKRENVPSFLGVDNPLDDFTLRLNIILETVVSDYNRTIVEHSKIPHAEHDFQGCALMTDQAESTRDAKNRSQQDVDATVGRMHKYLICSSVPFRAMMDTLIGDALSQVVMATGNNMSLCATEAARVLLTVNTLFAKHNELVDHELQDRGYAESLRIHIRASMAMGDVFVNQNEIRPTVICDTMNRAARFNGVAQKDEIVVDGDAHKYLDPYFRLTPAQPAEAIQEALDSVEKKLKKMAKIHGESPDTKELLLEKYELHSRAAKLCGILFHVFERRNLQDEQLQDANTHYLLEREKHEMSMKTLLVDGIRKKLCGVDEVAAIENSVGREYYQERFAKATGIKLKGLDKNEINVWKLHGYLTFKEDLGSVPKECRFRELFLGGNYQGENGGKSELEKFVEDVSTHYGCPTKTNFNPLAEFYIMYLMQHTGSPSFAFNTACRASGVALYVVEDLQKNWDSQPDGYLQSLQEKMVEIGIFDAKGNVDQEKLKEYIAKQIVLPSLLAEVGLLKLANPPESDQGVTTAFSKAQRIGGIFAKSLATVQADHGPEVVDTIKNLHQVSRDLLIERNAAARERGATEDIFPQETIEVLGRLSFSGRNQAICKGCGDETDLAIEIIRLSRMVQSMRTRKAHQAEKPAVDWVTIGSELSTTELYPYMRRVYRELFLAK